ncbi:MAG: hypothetical protein KIS72_06960 [Luteimonas sp.]|nr:hypothetical protein [Luteimonas sp.]
MDIALWSAAHLLVIGYWLGTDLAVYYLSGFIVDSSRPLAARLLATRSMLVLDMVPRTALILTTVLGLTLSARLGLIPGLQPWLGLLWAVGLAWLALTLTVFKLEGKSIGHVLAWIDFGFRVLLVAAAAWLAVDSGSEGGVVAHAPWLGAKIALLGLSIAMGLVIRLQLKPFGPLFSKVAAGTASAQDEAALRRLIAQVKVPVWVIWIAVILAAVLGSTHWVP